MILFEEILESRLTID